MSCNFDTFKCRSNIHGDRRNKQDSLIQGHGHDLDEKFDEWYEANKGRDKFRPMKRGRKGRLYRNDDPTYLAYFLADETKGNWRSQTRYDAIETVARYIEDYYEASAKKTEEVLQRNAMYFQSLQSIKTVLVIGHSLSTVDEPYFKEIIRWNQHCKSLQWIISWYSDVDLQSIDTFARKMGIAAESIRCFRI